MTQISSLEAINALLNSGILITAIAAVRNLSKIEQGLSDRINIVSETLNILRAEYKAHNEFIEYRLHGLNEKIDHKANRQQAEYKDIRDYLKEAHGFRPRSYIGDPPDSQG